MSNIVIQNSENVTQIPEILNQIKKYQYNPSGIQRVQLSYLKDITKGVVNIVDPTNPFIFALESSAVNTAAFMIENKAAMNRLYPRNAVTPDDIYLHMSDKDYIGRFATPSRVKFRIWVSLEEVKSKMILDTTTGIRKLVIPRNSYFTIAETDFSIQYPIEIRQLKHGGIQVVYNTDKISPLQTLDTNTVNWRVISDKQGSEILIMEFDTTQFTLQTSTHPITSAKLFSNDFRLTDHYYHARIYYRVGSNPQWTEMLTTHTDQVYDTIKPTAILQVKDKVLNVTIPQVYLNTKLIDGRLRVDIYETKGDVNMIMSNYTVGSFDARWWNVDANDDTKFTTMWNSLSTVRVNSAGVASGGTLPMTFEYLRKQVIENTVGDRSIPITNTQIQNSLVRNGYSLVKNVDIVTNRIILATKPLPDPIHPKLITAANSTIQTLVATTAAIRSNTNVFSNLDRTTITPDVIYRDDNGIIKMIPQSEIDEILSYSPDDIVYNVSNNKYLYSPFHYVMDNTNDEFTLRPYYLDSPKALTRSFVATNDTTGLQVYTANYELKRSDTGYQLLIKTASDKSFKQIHDDDISVLLSFVPYKEVNRCYIKGELVSKDKDNERVYSFDLSTNFDIDSDHCLYLTKALMFTLEPRVTKATLTQDVDIIYSTNIEMDTTFIPGSIDNILGRFLISDNSVGISQDKIRLYFGNFMDNLWSRSRSVVGSAPIQKYVTDIPWTYPEDIYKIDPVTGSGFSISATGDIVYTKLHNAGDIVKDMHGNPTYKHRAGDPILDSNGNTMPIDSNLIIRQIDLFFIEGVYKFATDLSAITYRDTIVNSLVEWITVDLNTISKSLLEQTNLFFYPKKTMGEVKALLDTPGVTSIEAGQSFKLLLYVSDLVYQDIIMRKSLTRKTIETIYRSLDATQIAVSTIISTLRAVYGDDVISFTMNKLGPNKETNTISLLNDGDRLGIRKKLFKQQDNKLIVVEDIEVEFVRHSAQ